MVNILAQVQTYQMANMAFLLNSFAFINNANKKFMNFQNLTANLGSTVTFELPPRFTTRNSLVAQFQDAVQQVESLTVDKEISTAYAFTNQEILFNVEDYMSRFGEGATKEIGSKIEAHVARVCVESPYRFYGDGRTQLNSFNQLATALALYRNYGAPKSQTKCFLSDIAVPGIIANGLNQFATARNNDNANSWEVGAFSQCDFFESNLLPVHTAGTEGDANTLLTVVSVVKNADDAVISITFSGTNAANDANSVKLYDKFEFVDGVAGQPNMRYLTWIGHEVSANSVQFKSTADAISTAGSQVTVSVYPPLKASGGQAQNINNEIAAGMQVRVLPSHRAGLIMAGDPLFLAMPRLPDQPPFPTSSEADEDSGVSIRLTYGSQFGQNQQGMIHDAIWGRKLPPQYGMSVIFPL
jgi:hypothetical protein